MYFSEPVHLHGEIKASFDFAFSKQNRHCGEETLEDVLGMSRLFFVRKELNVLLLTEVLLLEEVIDITTDIFYYMKMYLILIERKVDLV